MTAIATIRGFYAIPRGTKQSFCDLCGQPIYWIEHRCKPKRKGDPGKVSRLPISIRGHVLAMAPTEATNGQGFNHFADCIYAPQHTRTQR